MSKVKTRYTAEDLLTMPDGDRYELVGGRLVEKQMGMKAAAIAGRVFRAVDRFLDSQPIGRAFPDGAGYQCFSDDREKVRKPDVSFVAKGRLPGDEVPEGHATVPPDLAVEVISPNDRYGEIDIKIGEYLAAGVKLVWIVSPDSRTVKVYRPGETAIRVLRETDTLDGEDVLPGFRCPVGDLFAV